MIVKQGSRIKIKSGQWAGKIGVCVAKAPGSNTAWNVSFPGAGQVRVEEKDMEDATVKKED
jgi:hypothetical protein